MHKLTSAPPLKRGDRHLCSRHPLLLLLPQGSTCFLKQGGGLNVFGLQRLHLAQCLRNPQHLMLPVESSQEFTIFTLKNDQIPLVRHFVERKNTTKWNKFSASHKKKWHPNQPTIQKPTHLSNPHPQQHPQRSISPTCPWSALSSARAASTSERCRRTSASAAALASLNFAATWAFATCRSRGKLFLNRLKSIQKNKFVCLCWFMIILIWLCLFRVITPMLFSSWIDLRDDRIEDSKRWWWVFEGFLAHNVCSGLCIWGCEYFDWALLRDRESTCQVVICSLWALQDDSSLLSQQIPPWFYQGWNTFSSNLQFDRIW